MDASIRSTADALPGAERSNAGQLPHKGSGWFLALTALGVVFGDIGTSPLYTFSVALNATGHAPPTAADVLGVVSLIFWALMAMVSLKYVVFVLRADNDGEGGILALLSLVAPERVANGARIPFLVLLGIVGAALLYGDGVITPAISVLSAMEGLKLVTPAFDKFILPFTLAILIGLFMIQRRGTASIGRLFGPVMVVWFVVIGLLGLINIWAAPEILKAFSPIEAARFVAANCHRLRGDGRRFPRADRRGGTLRRHGSCRAHGDPPRLVRLGPARVAVELLRAGGIGSCRSARSR
jgi:KUP system potassium uptake protein